MTVGPKSNFRALIWSNLTDFGVALLRDEWDAALQRGDLSMLRDEEAFWGFIWPTLSHNHEPQLGSWSVPKHGGLKELIDHVISVIGWAD